MGLHPCPRCDRHVFASETLCPFCRVVLRPSGKLGRVAGIVALASLGVGWNVDAGPDASRRDGADAAVAEDAGGVDAGEGEAGDVDAGERFDGPERMVVPLYGVPPSHRGCW